MDIAYWTLGEGPALIVPPPALPFSHLQLEWDIPEMRHWYEHLGEGRQLVRFDNRGSGLSQRDVDDFSCESLVRDMESVADQLELEQFDLFGFYYAGPATVAYAALHPERVRSLVLWCSFASVADVRNSQANPQLNEALKSLIKADFEVFTETLSHSVFGWAAGEQAHRFAEFMRNSLTADTAQLCWEQNDDLDVSDRLSQVRCPTLVLQRREFPMLGIDVARGLASRIPNAHLTLLEGASLSPYVGDMETALRTIDEFLGTTRGADRPRVAPHRHPGTAAGLRTILFTDMAESTATTQRLGDAEAQELVRVHNTVVRDALRAHDGVEVKHTGDGIMASFVSATGALECAIAIQRALAWHSEEHPDAAMAVRIGLNPGEPVAEADDLFGTAVQLASRVCTHAEPDQILVPEALRHLVAGKGFLFGDRGEVLLRGFEDRVRLFEVRWRPED